MRIAELRLEFSNLFKEFAFSNKMNMGLFVVKSKVLWFQHLDL